MTISFSVVMATHTDPVGVYFTLQALTLYHPCDGVELLVVDNAPESSRATQKAVEDLSGRYIHAPEIQGTAYPRDRAFQEASGDFVLCIDCHVLLCPGVLQKLRDYCEAHPESNDLLQGPMLHDGHGSVCTHFTPTWNERMWGQWNFDPRGHGEEPFEIPMQGLGLFAMRKAAWPGFSKYFRGFGGEEGYLHEKVRRRGDKCLCLPWLRWVHRYRSSAEGLPYRALIGDRIANYLIGFRELGLNANEVFAHFTYMGDIKALQAAAVETERVLPRPVEVGAPLFPAMRGAEKQPLISCLCPTYGRAPDYLHLLEEVIESFLRQDDVDSELVILNDCSEQKLVFEHPRIRIVNSNIRCSSLGAKYNELVCLANGPLLCVWEDDDICLPRHLSFLRKMLGNADYYNPSYYWYADKDGLHRDHSMGVGHNCSIFTRRAFDLVGGYPEVSGTQDMLMDQKLRDHVDVVSLRPVDWVAEEEWTYIYRWGVSPVHLSGTKNPAAMWDELGNKPHSAGAFVLQPAWHKNYLAEALKEIQRQRADAQITADLLSVAIVHDTADGLQPFQGISWAGRVILNNLQVGDWQDSRVGAGRFLLVSAPTQPGVPYRGMLAAEVNGVPNPDIRQNLRERVRKLATPSTVLSSVITTTVSALYDVTVQDAVAAFLEELNAYTNALDTSGRPTIVSHDLICHVTVWDDWLKYWRRCVNHFHEKYGFDIPYIRDKLTLADLHRLITSQYFAGRTDLTFVPLYGEKQ